MIVFAKSGINRIFNTTFTDVNTLALKVSKSTIEKVEKVKFNSTQQGLFLDNSTLRDIMHSEYLYCGDASVLSGGAIKAINSEINIHKSQFASNTAVKGASISIECDFDQT